MAAREPHDGDEVRELDVTDVARQLGVTGDRVRQLDNVLQPRLVKTPGGYSKRFYDPSRVKWYLAFVAQRAEVAATRANFDRDVADEGSGDD